jgi:Rgg/GadR/MutR family transcriptional activator
MLSAMIHDLDHNFPISEDVFQNASNYLFKTTQWSYYELSLFCNVAHVLKIDLSCALMRNIINHKEIFCDTRDRKRLLIITLINVMYPCLQHNYFDDFNDFFELAYRLIVEERDNCMREECTLDFLKGLYMFITGHKDNGRKVMSNVINFLLLRNYDELVKQFQSYYDEVLIKDIQRRQEKRE